MNVWGRFKMMLAQAGQICTLKDPRYWPHLSGGRQTVSHEYVNEDIALNYSAVWCATKLLCGTGASLPLPIYRGLDGESRTKERKHGVHVILNKKPNPEQTAYSFRSLMWQWQVNWGNAYAEIVREGGTEGAPVRAVWPLHPSRVTMKRDENGDLVYEVRNPNGIDPSILPPWRMLHVPSILTEDGVNGHGVVAHARESIGAGIAAEKKAAHSFGAGNVPRVVVKHPAKWDDVQRAAFRKEWHELYDSPTGENLGVLGGGADIVSLGFSNQDSQFLESRQFDVEEIARWYGIPPHMLQHLLRATFNNIEELGIEFVQYSLIPWLRIWEQAIWQKLLTEDEQAEYFAEHNVDALLRGNSAARAAFYHSGINDGWLLRNEARKLENLDELPGGDVPLVQGAMVPLGDDGAPVMPEKPAAMAPKNDDGQVETIRAEMQATATRLLKRDLARMLTKEAKAVLQIAKSDDNCTRKLDEFYGKHVQAVHEATCDVAPLLLNGKASTLASSWCALGKLAVTNAWRQTKTKDERIAKAQSLIESNSWTERPERTIDGMAA